MRDEDLKALVKKPRRAPGEFREGDIVTCMKEGLYVRTDAGVRCEVNRVISDERIRVQILEGRHRDETHDVASEYFELLEESQA